VAVGVPASSGNNVAVSGEKLPPAEPTAPPPVPVVDVERAVQRLNELASRKERSLRFQVDQGSGRTVITVINATTKEIIRQIPPEELLAIARNLEELGPLIDARV
jgi:flagellar protein FlaG